MHSYPLKCSSCVTRRLGTHKLAADIDGDSQDIARDALLRAAKGWYHDIAHCPSASGQRCITMWIRARIIVFRQFAQKTRRSVEKSRYNVLISAISLTATVCNCTASSVFLIQCRSELSLTEFCYMKAIRMCNRHYMNFVTAKEK